MGRIIAFISGVNGFVYLILPLLVYLSIFYAYPMFQMISRSFLDPNVTLKHYAEFFRISAFKLVMVNTFVIAFFTTLLCLVIGYPIAYLMTTGPQKVGQVLLLLIVAPIWISILIRSYAWMVLLGRNGVINQLLIQIGVITAPISLMHNRFAVYVGMINVLLPFMVLPLYSVMKDIDRNLVKSAQILGAAPWRAFLRVFFPLSLPGIAGGGLLVFILALGYFITPALLGGPKDTMISLLIQAQVEQFLNWGFASALATVLLVCALAVFCIYNRFLGLDRLVGR